jgi:hypothetical protein
VSWPPSLPALRATSAASRVGVGVGGGSGGDTAAKLPIFPVPIHWGAGIVPPMGREAEVRSAIVAPAADVEQLSNRVAADALRPWSVASRALGAGEPARPGARALLEGGGELSIVPLVGAALSGAGDHAWAMGLVVESTNDLRAAIVRWLEPLLDDAEPVDASTGAPPGVPSHSFGGALPPRKPPLDPVRVCDEAFLALIRVIRFDRNELDPEMDTERFLVLSHRRRSAFIAGIKNTKTFRRARERGAP